MHLPDSIKFPGSVASWGATVSYCSRPHLQIYCRYVMFLNVGRIIIQSRSASPVIFPIFRKSTFHRHESLKSGAPGAVQKTSEGFTKRSRGCSGPPGCPMGMLQVLFRRATGSPTEALGSSWETKGITEDSQGVPKGSESGLIHDCTTLFSKSFHSACDVHH